ncbi:MAG: TFIIB-type zinc ribbon-containing protein [Candidatus Micrarchaeaceae archaeon]
MTETKPPESVEKCPMCGSKKLVWDDESGEIVCANCGYVVENPEWENTENKAGSPTDTVIGNKDVDGKSISGANKLRIWDSRSKPTNLVFDELTRMSNKLNVPKNAVEEAARIYKKAHERGISKSNVNALVSASLYAACRLLEVPRSFKDIVMVSKVKKRKIAKCYALILKELDIKMPVVSPLLYVNRIASHAGISEHATRKAIEMLKDRSNLTVSKDPTGLAATALYIACIQEGEHKTQNTIARVAGITEVTIRNHFKVFGYPQRPKPSF